MSAATAATAAEVAAWMVAQIEQTGQLAHAEAVAGIRARFGPEFTRGRGLRNDVMVAFRRLAPEGRAWDVGAQAWRRRDRFDPPAGGRAR